MSGHRTMEKRKAEGEKNRGVASSFRKTRAEENGDANARLQAQKELDARIEATVRGLMNATVTAMRSNNVTDSGDDHPFPDFVLIDGGLNRFVEGESAVSKPIEGFSAVPEEHLPIEKNAFAVFCSKEIYKKAAKLLASRER